MREMIFDLQRFAQVLVGKSGGDKLVVIADKTQVYGLAGNDTLESNGKNDILLIGGSGNDIFNVTGGTTTLSGGKGKNTFNLSYSASQKISAVIEDIDPKNDKIVITYDGNAAPKLKSVVSNEDVIWRDESGNFNLTLKGSSDTSDYYEGKAHEYIWDVLWIVNQEREKEGLPPLTLSQGLIDGASIRAQEIVELFEHTRPNGTRCFTAVKKSYFTMGENIAAGYGSPEYVVRGGWMNSEGHRANILNENFKKLGVGYINDSGATYNTDYWVQMFGGNLSSPDTISTDEILKTKITTKKGTIPAASNSKLLSGTKYADYLRNDVAGANIQALAGNDTIKNYSNGTNVTIAGGVGNDSIENYGAKASIIGGAGNDSFGNNAGKNVTIDAGAGNDYIHNNDSEIIMNCGDGADIVWNSAYGFNATINGGAGNDEIDTFSDDVFIEGGSGNDALGNACRKNVTISGDDGDDYIYSNSNQHFIGKNVSINGGTGNDSIKIYEGSFDITINGGTGNDSIKISEGSLDITINGGTGNDSIKNEGSNVSISSGDDNDYVWNNGSNILINGDTGNDSIKNYYDGSNVTINTGAGNDSIENYSSKVTMNCGSGNDTVINYYGGKDSSILGGEGNDYIESNAENVTIVGGAGNDSIYNTSVGDNMIISGGKGNDSIFNTGDNVRFNYSLDDGFDLIEGFNATSTLNISGGKYSSTKNGSDIIITVGNGKITLSGAATLSKVNIKGTKVTTTLKVTNKTKSPVTVSSAIKTINAASRTKDIKITGNARANNISGGTKDDTIDGATGNDLILGNSGNDSLVGNAGNDTINGGNGNDKIYGNAGNDSLVGGNGNDAISGGAGSDRIYGNAGNDNLYGGDGNDAISGGIGNDKISGNAGNDNLHVGAGNDTLIGGAGNDKLWGDAGKDMFVYESGDGRDIIYGFDNMDMLKITGAFSGTYSKKNKEVAFKVGSTTSAITLKDFSATSFNVNGSSYRISGSKLVKK